MENWKALVETTMDPEDREGEEFQFGPPATEAEMAEVETALGLKIPEEMRSFLKECNGADQPFGAWVVFPIAEMISENQGLREDYADWKCQALLPNVLFFSDIMGTGDMYGICASPFEGVAVGEIVLFDHETGTFTVEDATLKDFLTNWP